MDVCFFKVDLSSGHKKAFQLAHKGLRFAVGPYIGTSLLDQRYYFAVRRLCIFNRCANDTILKLGKHAFF